MTGHERFGLWQFRIVEPRALIRAPEHRQHLAFDFNRRHRPSNKDRKGREARKENLALRSL
jgi:hypothetical protein